MTNVTGCPCIFWTLTGNDGQEPHHDLRPEGRRHLRRRVHDQRGRHPVDLDPENRGARDPAFPRADAIRTFRARCCCRVRGRSASTGQGPKADMILRSKGVVPRVVALGRTLFGSWPRCGGAFSWLPLWHSRRRRLPSFQLG